MIEQDWESEISALESELALKQKYAAPLTWVRDYFGNMTQHVDMGGSTSTVTCVKWRASVAAVVVAFCSHPIPSLANFDSRPLCFAGA